MKRLPSLINFFLIGFVGILCSCKSNATGTTDNAGDSGATKENLEQAASEQQEVNIEIKHLTPEQSKMDSIKQQKTKRKN